MNEIIIACTTVLAWGNGHYFEFDVPKVAESQEVWLSYGTEDIGYHRIWVDCHEVKTQEPGDWTTSYGYVSELWEGEYSGTWLPVSGVRCRVLTQSDGVKILVTAETDCEEVKESK